MALEPNYVIAHQPTDAAYNVHLHSILVMGD